MAFRREECIQVGKVMYRNDSALVEDRVFRQYVAGVRSMTRKRVKGGGVKGWGSERGGVKGLEVKGWVC